MPTSKKKKSTARQQKKRIRKAKIALQKGLKDDGRE